MGRRDCGGVFLRREWWWCGGESGGGHGKFRVGGGRFCRKENLCESIF